MADHRLGQMGFPATGPFFQMDTSAPSPPPFSSPPGAMYGAYAQPMHMSQFMYGQPMQEHMAMPPASAYGYPMGGMPPPGFNPHALSPYGYGLNDRTSSSPTAASGVTRSGRRALAHHDPTRSCLPCAKGKRRCDGGRPCSRCVTMNKSDLCVDAPVNYKKILKAGGSAALQAVADASGADGAGSFSLLSFASAADPAQRDAFGDSRVGSDLLEESSSLVPRADSVRNRAVGVKRKRSTLSPSPSESSAIAGMTLLHSVAAAIQNKHNEDMARGAVYEEDEAMCKQNLLNMMQKAGFPSRMLAHPDALLGVVAALAFGIPTKEPIGGPKVPVFKASPVGAAAWAAMTGISDASTDSLAMALPPGMPYIDPAGFAMLWKQLMPTGITSSAVFAPEIPVQQPIPAMPSDALASGLMPIPEDYLMPLMMSRGLDVYRLLNDSCMDNANRAASSYIAHWEAMVDACAEAALDTLPIPAIRLCFHGTRFLPRSIFANKAFLSLFGLTFDQALEKMTNEEDRMPFMHPSSAMPRALAGVDARDRGLRQSQFHGLYVRWLPSQSRGPEDASAGGARFPLPLTNSKRTFEGHEVFRTEFWPTGSVRSMTTFLFDVRHHYTDFVNNVDGSLIRSVTNVVGRFPNEFKEIARACKRSGESSGFAAALWQPGTQRREMDAVEVTDPTAASSTMPPFHLLGTSVGPGGVRNQTAIIPDHTLAAMHDPTLMTELRGAAPWVVAEANHRGAALRQHMDGGSSHPETGYLHSNGSVKLGVELRSSDYRLQIVPQPQQTAHNAFQAQMAPAPPATNGHMAPSPHLMQWPAATPSWDSTAPFTDGRVAVPNWNHNHIPGHVPNGMPSAASAPASAAATNGGCAPSVVIGARGLFFSCGCNPDTFMCPIESVGPPLLTWAALNRTAMESVVADKFHLTADACKATGSQFRQFACDIVVPQSYASMAKEKVLLPTTTHGPSSGAMATVHCEWHVQAEEPVAPVPAPVAVPSSSAQVETAASIDHTASNGTAASSTYRW